MDTLNIPMAPGFELKEVGTDAPKQVEQLTLAEMAARRGMVEPVSRVKSETVETEAPALDLADVLSMVEEVVAEGTNHSVVSPEAAKASIVKGLLDMTPEEREYCMYVSQGMVSRDRQARAKHNAYKMTPEVAVAIITEALRMVRTGGEVSATSIVSKLVPAEAVKSVLQRSFTSKAKKAVIASLWNNTTYKQMLELYGKGYVHGFFSASIGKAIRHITAQAKLVSRLAKLETDAAAGVEALARVKVLEIQVASLQTVQSSVKEVKTNTVKRAVDSELLRQIETAKAEGHTSIRAIAEATGINRNKVHRLMVAV